MTVRFPFITGAPIDTETLSRVGKATLQKVLAKMPDGKGRLQSQTLQVPLSIFKLPNVSGGVSADQKLMELNAGHVLSARHDAGLALKAQGKPAVDGTTFTYNLAEGLYRRAQQLCEQIGHKIIKVVTSFPKLQLVIEPKQI